MPLQPLVTDLSHHNNVTSYSEMKKAGLIGIIHKATQGTSNVDKRYVLRKERAQEAGMLWGAYHFATGAPVESQVNHFLKTVGDTSDTLLCLDFEPNPAGSSMTLRQAKDWLSLVEKRTGQRAVIYSGHWIKQSLGDKKDELLARHKLWLCQYGKKAVVPKNWDNYWLWQYAADGEGQLPRTVKGVDGYPDLNVHYKNDPDLLRKEWLELIGKPE